VEQAPQAFVVSGQRGACTGVAGEHDGELGHPHYGPHRGPEKEMEDGDRHGQVV
jgi:hypothetical protein